MPGSIIDRWVRRAILGTGWMQYFFPLWIEDYVVDDEILTGNQDVKYVSLSALEKGWQGSVRHF